MRAARRRGWARAARGRGARRARARSARRKDLTSPPSSRARAQKVFDRHRRHGPRPRRARRRHGRLHVVRQGECQTTDTRGGARRDGRVRAPRPTTRRDELGRRAAARRPRARARARARHRGGARGRARRRLRTRPNDPLAVQPRRGADTATGVGLCRGVERRSGACRGALRGSRPDTQAPGVKRAAARAHSGLACDGRLTITTGLT